MKLRRPLRRSRKAMVHSTSKVQPVPPKRRMTTKKKKRMPSVRLQLARKTKHEASRDYSAFLALLLESKHTARPAICLDWRVQMPARKY